MSIFDETLFDEIEHTAQSIVAVMRHPEVRLGGTITATLYAQVEKMYQLTGDATVSVPLADTPEATGAGDDARPAVNLTTTMRLAAFIAPMAGLQEFVRKANHRWWTEADGTPVVRNKGELLALIHSEVSEAVEGERTGAMDKHIPDRPSPEVELADAVIRILDYCAGYNYDLAGAIAEKLLYNLGREDHTHAARAKEGGKKW